MPRVPSIFVLLAALTLIGPSGPARAQGYKTTLVDGNFEVRDYPARQIVEMEVVGDVRITAYHGFRIFADPTLPSGTDDESAVLSTPVIETPAPSERFGTYPLFQLWNARVWTVSFEPPAGWTPAKLANTKTPKIRRLEVPPTRMAVLNFDGRGGVWDPGLGWRQAADDLVTQTARHGLKTQGPLMIAQYNAPQTTAVFRHFAVMIAVAN